MPTGARSLPRGGAVSDGSELGSERRQPHCHGSHGSSECDRGSRRHQSLYISKGLVARATSGNLDIEVIGEKVEATTGSGNISCTRVAQGVSAETGDGDIVLMLVGASSANVRKGTGRIEVGGARGNLIALTDAGDLHVKALPHEDWTLKTVSGKIHLELPPATSFNVDAESNSGELSIRRDDMGKVRRPGTALSSESKWRRKKCPAEHSKWGNCDWLRACWSD